MVRGKKWRFWAIFDKLCKYRLLIGFICYFSAALNVYATVFTELFKTAHTHSHGFLTVIDRTKPNPVFECGNHPNYFCLLQSLITWPCAFLTSWPITSAAFLGLVIPGRRKKSYIPLFFCYTAVMLKHVWYCWNVLSCSQWVPCTCFA